MTLEERVAQLEAKVVALEQALHIGLASAQPAKNWLDATMERIDGTPRGPRKVRKWRSKTPTPTLPDPGQP